MGKRAMFPYNVAELEKRIAALEDLLAVQLRKDADARSAIEQASHYLRQYGQLAQRFSKEKGQRMFKLAAELDEVVGE